MTDRKKSSLKFTNLHGHDTFSIFDGMGYPDEHIDFAYGNGLDGMAFTNHGSMNSFSYAFMKAKKMKDEGKTDFKVIYGIEAYSNHPIARSLVSELSSKSPEKIIFTKVSEEKGVCFCPSLFEPKLPSDSVALSSPCIGGGGGGGGGRGQIIGKN